MTQIEFNNLVDYIVEKKIKAVMCNKSVEYARGGDKLYNFKRSAEIDGVSPVQALRGMDLKHRTSILDMMDDFEKGIDYPKELWHEKLTDHLNYTLLLWALLHEEYDWENV